MWPKKFIFLLISALEKCVKKSNQNKKQFFDRLNCSRTRMLPTIWHQLYKWNFKLFFSRSKQSDRVPRLIREPGLPLDRRQERVHGTVRAIRSRAHSRRDRAVRGDWSAGNSAHSGTVQRADWWVWEDIRGHWEHECKPSECFSFFLEKLILESFRLNDLVCFLIFLFHAKLFLVLLDLIL